MTRKIRTTFEEHKKLGESLKIIRDALLDDSLTVEKNYGKTSKEARKFVKALEIVDDVRSLLDCRVFAETRDKSFEELVSVYYPGNINEKKYAKYITVTNARSYATVKMYLWALPDRFGLGVESLGQIYEYCRKLDIPNASSPGFSDKDISVRVLKEQSAGLVSLLEECLDKDCPDLKTATDDELIKEILHDASTGRTAKSKLYLCCNKTFLKKFSWDYVSDRKLYILEGY